MEEWNSNWKTVEVAPRGTSAYQASAPDGGEIDAQNEVYFAAGLGCGVAGKTAGALAVRPMEVETAWTEIPRFAAICLTLMPSCSMTLACAVAESFTVSLAAWLFGPCFV